MHIVFQTMAYTVRHRPEYLKKLINLILREAEDLTLTTTVKTILFDGYEDKLLKFAVKFNLTEMPYEKFGWFYGVSISLNIIQCQCHFG